MVIREPADAVRAGIGMVPEDRKQDGLLLAQSIRVNTTLATLPRHTRAGGLAGHACRNEDNGLRCAERLAVRCASLEQAVSELSGGNQQKVVIGRWLARDCSVLLFDEPTRGIDVAAKDMVYQLLRDLAADGKAVVFVSSELTELMAVCDRILVMSAGRIAGGVPAGRMDAGEDHPGRLQRLLGPAAFVESRAGVSPVRPPVPGQARRLPYIIATGYTRPGRLFAGG